MSDEQQQSVTLGEVYRLCQRIEIAVKEQNGRVTKLEKDAIRIKAFWSAGVLAIAAVWPYVKGKLGIP